jgi:hypothetical protein
VLGDRAKFHRHTAYVAYGAPIHQVQARPLLDTDQITWIAGRQGGRPMLGPWVPDALRTIRGVAVATDGELWVAEGEAFPKRFSVWDTTEKEGKVARELFGSASIGGRGGAINPLEPDVMVAQNCEWRIDHKTGGAKCLGVIARDLSFGCARFGVGANGHAYLVASYGPEGRCPVRIFERIGDGDYKLRARMYFAFDDGKELGVNEDPAANASKTVFWADKNGDGVEQADEVTVVPKVLDVDLIGMHQNLTLQYQIPPNEGWLLSPAGWTKCGAPFYDLGQARKLPSGTRLVGSDERFCLASAGDESSPSLACFEIATGRRMWNILSGPADASGFDAKPQREPSRMLVGGTAHLPAPLNNLWVVGEYGGRWRIITEDGFMVGYIFAVDKEAHWPAAAVPGADLSAADARASASGSVTEGKDGKLYIEAGDQANWNAELTGLDKVKAIAGGKLIVPAKEK